MKNIFIYVDYIKSDYNSLIKNKAINEIHIARSYNKAIELLETYKGENIIIDLTYDLSSDKNGYDICKYIIKFNIPLLFFHIHSSDSYTQAMREELLLNGYKEFS